MNVRKSLLTGEAESRLAEMMIQRERWEPGLCLDLDRNHVLKLLLRLGWGGRGQSPAGPSSCLNCHFTVAGPGKATDEATAFMP